MSINQLLSFQSTMRYIGYGALAVLMLLLMITVHEFGHYIVGKLFKFKINEFAIGMGPAVYKRTRKNGEVFSVRLLPLGGYCAFEGEDEDNADENAFNNKPPWQRILVLAAGATMNYLLALFVIYLSFGIYGQALVGPKYVADDPVYAERSLEDGDKILSLSYGNKKTGVYLTTDLIYALNGRKKGDEITAEVLRDGKVVKIPVTLRSDVDCANITEVDKTYLALGVGSAFSLVAKEDSPFKTGDYLLKAATGENYENSVFINSEADFINYLADKNAGDEVAFWISREGERVLVSSVLSDEWGDEEKSGALAAADYFGVEFSSRGFYTSVDYVKFGFFRSVARGFVYSFKIGGTIFRSLGELITGRIGLKSVGGTVTTVVTATQVISYGFVYALEIMALIGVNLAVFNLLPIPALDGSRIVFCLIEWIRGKPVNRKIEGIIHLVGFALILGFAVLVDILHFI